MTKYSLPQIAKALGAFVAALGTMAGLLLADENFSSVVPAPVLAILGSLVAAGVVAGIVFKIPNAQTEDQVVQGAIRGGADVVNKVIDEAQKAGLPIIPAPVNTGIDVIQEQVGKIISVGDVLKSLPNLTPRSVVEDLINVVTRKP